MRRWAKLRHRIGHRGTFLITIGIYDIFYGWYLAIGGQIQALPLIGENPWGWIWISTGIFLIAGAFTKRDAIFFTLAIFIKVVWALEYFRLDYVEHIPDDWLRGCYWLALSCAILAAAWWPEPIHLTHPAEPTTENTVQRARDA
jgi:hypothetical protein